METRNLGPNGAYRTRLLTPPDLPALQGMFDRASDYFEVATGQKPAKDEANRAFVAGPPTKNLDDKRVIGVFDGADSLIGVLDALVDWPEENVWMMGMLLIDPAYRAAGVGSAVLGAYEGWARDHGAKELRTAVVSHHAPGITFITQRGYGQLSVLNDYNAGSRPAQVLFFVKTL